MRNVLELKIEDWWAVLAPDTSISIEMTSPLWNDSGTFSYTFQLPYSANRHIFNASDKPESDVNLKTFRKRFELYLYGVGFLFGDIVCTSDEIDTDNDRVDVEIRSANATFEDAIDGKSLRDLDLGETIHLGRRTETIRNDGVYEADKTYPVINTTEIYPSQKFCNISVLVTGERWRYDGKKKGEIQETKIENGESGFYLSPYRPWTSPCIFVLHVLKTIFQNNQYAYDEQKDNELMKIEDMKRLVFINTKFKYKWQPDIEDSENIIKKIKNGNVYGTSENLPDTPISDFINSLKEAFGMRISVDESLKRIKVYLIKNVLRSTEVKTLHIKDTLSVKRLHRTFDGITVKYNTDDGEEFNYSDYKKMKTFNSFEEMLTNWESMTDEEREEDVVLKIDKESGNFFRTKVDSSSYDKASLFEVATFLPYEVQGDLPESEKDERTISFTPVIPTRITKKILSWNIDKQPQTSIFIDETIKYYFNSPERNGALDIRSKDEYGWQEDKGYYVERFYLDAQLDRQKPLLDHDCGFMIGIMRNSVDGSLSESYTVTKENVDGFGNDEWTATLSTSDITSDSLSIDGKMYDYNGTDEGIGAPMEQLVSLKLWNGKQNFDPSSLVSVDEDGNTLTGADVYNNNPTGPLPNRGLVPQFLSEYLHFLKHRKPISVVGNVHVSELLNIEWDKYYDVAGYRGLLDKIKFSVSMEGMSEVTVEHYII